MAIKREPVQIVEIDIDFCTLTYGTGSCTAVLGTDSQRKCFNSWNTCPVKTSFVKGSLTLRFINSRSNLPIDGNIYFPTLDSVSAFSSSVNIAGSNPKLGQLGKRGKVTVQLQDFPYHDRYTDKYADERVSGDAQVDEGGYNPVDRGTFWTKFKKRHPNYAGRPLRVKNAYILEDGTLSVEQTRHFIITDLVGPSDNNSVTLEAKDILSLAEKQAAVAPKASNGQLASDITTANSISFDLTPAGIGDDEYPASGYAAMGRELVQYTRSSDTITLTARGEESTEAKEHKTGATFQQALRYTNQNIDDVVTDLLTNYTSIDPTFIPSADYAAEIDVWAPNVLINTTIVKPTSVAELLGEMSVLGTSIWWDDVAQEVKLAQNKPLDFQQVPTAISDDDSIKAIDQKDRDEERITQVHFYSVQTDPFGGVKDKSNYDRINVTLDPDAQNVNNYNETRIREVFCRWLNVGNDIAVNLASSRLLKRFNSAPIYTTITLDAKDISIGLFDILNVTSRVITDGAGKPLASKLQVVEKTETRSGHEVKIVAQSYNYPDARGFIMVNTAPDYSSATEEEKNGGCYIIAAANSSFPDGREAYQIS